MKITSSSVQLGAETSSVQKHHEKHESLTMWKGDREHRTVHGNGQGKLRQEAEIQIASRQDVVTISDPRETAGSRPVPTETDADALKPNPVDQVKLDILKAMIEKLTGRKIRIILPEEIIAPDKAAGGAEKTAPGGQNGWNEGVSMIYDSYESHYEYESMNFSASGSISTSDGRQIDFSVNLNMTREFYTEQHIQLRAGDALKDPLAVNFSGTASELTQKKFEFDIDADGRDEQISFVKPGSGFLALDKNNDGRINNGKELFGAVTGNGFTELSHYDTDNNNFIDENDSIYNSLRIWQKDENGRDRLLALGQAGVGAIFLGKAASSFDIKDQGNNLMGRVNSTGLFLRENGSAGTIQQIDLVV